MSWIPSLFAAEAIPSAMITFVALLMFLQMGETWGVATLLCGLLTLPWVLKSFVRAKVERMGHLALQLRVVETAIFADIVVLAFCFTSGSDRVWDVFASLFVLCLLCAWHELAARLHYEHMLRPPLQRYYNGIKMFASQSAVVVTYGIMIVGVGFLEVFYHNRRDVLAQSWSLAVYALAGIYLLLVAYNMFALPGTSQSQYASVREGRHHGQEPQTTDDAFSTGDAIRAEVRVLDRLVHKRHWWAVFLALTVLLVPQALMFHTRVLFFLAPHGDGGLGATLQEIGLAQGTVGVMAFCAGMVIGSLLADSRRWALTAATFVLPLSPLVYWHLAATMPTSLPTWCAATFVAQLLFGFGLNACMPYVRFFSGDRYRSTTGFLYIPLVALAMLPTMAVSGWLVERWGFTTFFAIDSAMILPAWAAAACGARKTSRASRTSRTSLTSLTSLTSITNNTSNTSLTSNTSRTSNTGSTSQTNQTNLS